MHSRIFNTRVISSPFPRAMIRLIISRYRSANVDPRWRHVSEGPRRNSRKLIFTPLIRGARCAHHIKEG